MTATRYLQVLMIITLTVAGAVRLSCEPGEEFKSHNLTCDVSQGRYPFLLTIDGFLISMCSLNQTPACDKSNGPYVTSLMNQTITLNILNVTRQTEGKYSCSDVQNSVSSCDFKVYAKPKSVSCQVPQLQTTNVTVTCTVTKIYPSPICQFYWSKNGTETSLTDTNITYQNISGEGQPDYFYQTCTLTQPAQNLGLGSHSFRVRAYPNVTGNTSDTNYGIYSSQTLSFTINYPTVQLESCPQGYVQEGSPVSCSCRETANTFLSATTNISQGSTVQSSGPGFTTYTFTASRNNMGDLTCQATLMNWTSSPVTYKPQVGFGPTIVSITLNGNTTQTEVEKDSTLSISCAAEGNPIPSLTLSMNGLQLRDYNATQQKINISLTFNKTQTDCRDAGVYSCQAQTGQAVANKSVDVNVRCQQELENPDTQNMVYVVKASGSIDISVAVFGYPEPSLQLTSGRVLRSEEYRLTYTKQRPSYGVVSLQIYTVTADLFQNYSLNITNSLGTLVYSFQIQEEDTPVGAIVGGVVGGVLVIASIVLAVLLLKRRGSFNKKDRLNEHMSIL